MTDFDQGELDCAMVNKAVMAILSEDVPPGPPDSIAAHLNETWLRSQRGVKGPRAKSRLLALSLAVFVVLGSGVYWRVLGTRDDLVLADVAKEFHRAKSIQFRTVHYEYAYGDVDKTTVWRGVAFEECSFKSPGFRREVSFNHDGVPWRIQTGDAVRGITLELKLSRKIAVLTENDPATASQLKRGLHSSLSMLENWLEHGKVRMDLGTREIHGRTTVGLRLALGDREADFWVDRQTRRIVRFLEPTATVYDPDNDPVAKNPVQSVDKAAFRELKGWVWTDIVYEPSLDDAQYILTPPEDYKLERIKFRDPTEKDLLEWLEVFAQVRGGTFTDHENPFADDEVSDKLLGKSPEQLSSWEDKLVRGYIEKEEVPLNGNGGSVLGRFHKMYPDTWHYQGKDVKLGDAQVPVCWYRRNGAKAYRVVYGDLSVRDVEPNNLPRKR